MAGNLAHGDRAAVLTVKAGEYVFSERDSVAHFFVIEEGEVELLQMVGSAPRRLALLGAGDCIGEAGLSDRVPSGLAARAMRDCRLLKLEAGTLALLVQRKPAIALHLLQRLGRRCLDAERAVATGSPGAGAAQVFPARAAGATSPRAVAASPASALADETRLIQAPLSPPARLVHSESGREFVLPVVDRVIVGRADPRSRTRPDIDLSAIDTKRSLSRSHARVVRRGSEVYLAEEARVANGTFVNGQRLVPAMEVKLRDGDQVCFGLVATVFRMP